MANKLVFAVPVEHNKNSTYETNMIVFVGKKAYTAIQNVPSGIDITNKSYWIETGVPQTDLSVLENAITTLQEKVSTLESSSTDYNTRITNNANSITSIQADLADAQTLIDNANIRLDNIMITLYTPSAS